MDKNKIIDYTNGVNTGIVLEPLSEEDHLIGGVTVGGLEVLTPEPKEIVSDVNRWLFVNGANTGESQANDHFDSFLCTIHGVAGVISDTMKEVYNVDFDISECIQGVLAGVQPGVGGTIKNSIDSFRTKGWIEEAYRKFTESTTQAECFAVLTDAIINLCKDKLKDWNIYYRALSTSSNVPHSLIIDNLKKGEIVVAGYAWASTYGNEGVFYSFSNQANHCFRIAGGGDFRKNEKVKALFEGRGYAIDWNEVDLIAKDTYRYNWKKDPENDHTNVNDFLKPLAKSFQIHTAYLVYVVPKNNSIIKKFMDFIVMIVKTGALFWGKAGTNKIQKITPENAGLAAFTHIIRNGSGKPEVHRLTEGGIEEEIIKQNDYELTEEFFGSGSKLGVANELIVK